MRLIFGRCLELGSLRALLADLRQRGTLTKVRSLSNRRTIGGIPFTRGPLAYLLHNRFYVGEIAFKGQVYAAEHPPILDRATFDAVQVRLAEQRYGTAARHRASGALLTGHIYDEHGRHMTPTHASKAGRRYCYYVSAGTDDRHPIRRIAAPAIERLVLEVSPRTFARHYLHRVGRTPAKVVEQFRLETARRALEEGDQSLKEITNRCGFLDEEWMRRAFQRGLGISHVEYRRRFSSTSSY